MKHILYPRRKVCDFCFPLLTCRCVERCILLVATCDCGDMATCGVPVPCSPSALCDVTVIVIIVLASQRNNATGAHRATLLRRNVAAHRAEQNVNTDGARLLRVRAKRRKIVARQMLSICCAEGPRHATLLPHVARKNISRYGSSSQFCVAFKCCVLGWFVAVSLMLCSVIAYWPTGHLSRGSPDLAELSQVARWALWSLRGYSQSARRSV